MILISVKDVGLTARVIPRHWKLMQQKAWMSDARLWHRTMRPKHFTIAGAREYGYDPRKGERGNVGRGGFRRSYTGRKLREKGHTLPLVWSGLSRNLTRVRDIRVTAKGVRVMIGTPGFNRRHRDSNIDMRREMTQISLLEQGELVTNHERVLQHLFRTIRTSSPPRRLK